MVRGNGDKDGGECGNGLMTLDEMFGVESTSENGAFPDELVSDSEKLAREFMEIVNRILENLEQDETESSEDESTPHPDTTPENIRALREALQRLVEVNPDPADLARLIEGDLDGTAGLLVIGVVDEPVGR